MEKIKKKVKPNYYSETSLAYLAGIIDGVSKSGWHGKPIPQPNQASRNNFYEMNRLLNNGYDPEFNGGYYDC